MPPVWFEGVTSQHLFLLEDHLFSTLSPLNYMIVLHRFV